MDSIERADIKKKLQHIGLNNLKGVSKAIKLETEHIDNLNDLAEAIIAKLENGVLIKENIQNLIDYFEFAHEVEPQTLGLTTKEFKRILGIEGTDRVISREELINRLRERIYKLEIKTNDIRNYRELFLEKRLKKIRKPEIRAFIASKLGGATIESISPEELVKLALEKVKSKNIENDELIKLIDTAQKELTAAGKKESNGQALQKIQNGIEAIERDIVEIKKILENLNGVRQTGYVRQYREKIGSNTEELLKTFKMIIQKPENQRENKFDEIVKELKKSNIDLSEFIEQAMLVICLDQISELVKPMRFPIQTGYFLNVLREETNKIHFASRPIIHKIRDAVTKRLEMSNEEFNKKLIECVKIGSINLIEGSPVSGKDDDWLDIAGRRFYYLEIKMEI